MIGIYLGMQDPKYCLASLLVLWLLTEMAIGDVLYRIIPDQLTILLAVSCLGFVSYQFSWKDIAAGGLTGFVMLLAIAGLGRLVYRKNVVGGGDIKLFTALGCIDGVLGVLFVAGLTALISAGYFIFLLATKRAKKEDALPMVPYIAAAQGLYLLFFYGNEFELLI